MLSYKVINTIIFLSFFLRAQWFQQTNGLPDYWYPGYAIDASDNQTAVISVGSNSTQDTRLFKTVDAGQSWFEIPTPTIGNSTLDIWDLSIVDSTRLWVCSGYNPRIYYTNNNGTTWVEQFYDTTLTDFINYIEMFDTSNGIAMGDALEWGVGPAIFLKTIDGGNTWISVNDSAFGGASGDAWRRLDFINPDVGYFIESGINPRSLYKTNDGGYNWEALPYTGGQALKFYDEDIGYIIQGIGSMSKTSDGGQTWTELDIPIDRWGIDIEFDPNSHRHVWFADLNSLWYMKDDGAVLVEQLHYTSSVPAGPIGFRDIVFTDSWNGWALVDEGVLYHTTNGGHSVFPEEDSLPHNTESVGPFTLAFSINDPSGTWSGQKMFHYSVNGVQDSLDLTYFLQANVWLVDLPEFTGITGTTELHYWLSFEHTVGDIYLWPEGAPDTYNTMIFGPDTTAPVLNELSDVTAAHYLIPAEKEVSINSIQEDRFDVNVQLHWRVNQGIEHSTSMDWLDSTYNDNTWSTSWKGLLSEHELELHDTVYYWVTATDVSIAQNVGISEINYFTLAEAEVIGDWELAASYEDIPFWNAFSYGMFTEFNSGDFQWNTVIAEGLQSTDWFRDTLRYERRLDFSQVDQAWLMVPMVYNLLEYNEAFLEISTNGQNWENLGYYTGQISPTVYQYDLSDYGGHDSIYFQFHIIHQLGNLWWMIDDITLHSDSSIVSIENNNLNPQHFQLLQNYPNPFNPVTTIQYELPERSNVQITIYNLLGRVITTLVSETQDAGFKSVQWDATNVASGVYLYQIRAGEYVQTRKMVLLK